MKLITAKAIYYSGLVLSSVFLIGIVILVMFWLLSNQQAFQLFVSLIGLLMAFVGAGLAYGWAEKVLEKERSYRND